MKVNTYIFMDLETTGLPSYQAYKTKITEISLVAVSVAHLKSSDIPRVLNKLNLCFYPRKFINPTTASISGLDNELLENTKPFTLNTFELLLRYFEQETSPICLVAHNGNRFDYPILNYELKCLEKQFPDEILCVDSLPAFRTIFALPHLTLGDISEDESDDDLCELLSDDMDSALVETSIRLETGKLIKRLKHGPKTTLSHERAINEVTPPKKNSQGIDSVDLNSAGSTPKVRRQLLYDDPKSPKTMKLGDVYSFLLKKKLVNAHQAEVDAYALMRCCGALHTHFNQWVETNCKPLNTCVDF